MYGAGSAGIAIAKHLLNLGVRDIIMLNRSGIICEGMAGFKPGTGRDGLNDKP